MMHGAKCFGFMRVFFSFPLFTLLCIYTTENEDDGNFCDRPYFQRSQFQSVEPPIGRCLLHKATF